LFLFKTKSFKTISNNTLMFQDLVQKGIILWFRWINTFRKQAIMELNPKTRSKSTMSFGMLYFKFT
jgi:hypothetical protein